jgi:hypothetical protein
MSKPEAGEFTLRSIRKCLVVVAAVLALGLLPASTAASSTKAFHLEKTCSGFTCVVTSSSFRKIPAGTTISYSGTSPDALTAVINVRHGSATGTCNIASVFASPSSPGRCVFNTGTGKLRGIHLDVAVTLDSSGVWHWDGRLRRGCNGGHRHLLSS